jgi:hypothetical protein
MYSSRYWTLPGIGVEFLRYLAFPDFFSTRAKAWFAKTTSGGHVASFTRKYP